MKSPTRQEFALNHGWRFVRTGLPARKLDRALEDGELIDLPHCWNGQDTFQKDVDYYRGSGTYLRAFCIPELEEISGNPKIVLTSEGFYGLAEILIDRRKVAKLDGQYMGFRLDLSQVVDVGKKHELTIRLSNRCPRWVLPGTSRPDFILFGGLAGRMSLEVVPELHLVEQESRLVAENLLGDRPRICISYALSGAFQARTELALRAKLVDRHGCTQSAIQIPLEAPNALMQKTNDLSVVEFELDASGLDLWSPEAPHLHGLEIDLQLGGESIDHTHHRLGLRDIRFDDRGFHLNGERYLLQGFNRHESLPGLGNALPECMHRADAQTLKEHGANLVRLSHYPQHPSFLDACDELGLLVYAELASWKTARGGRWRRSALRQMQAMIQRDRNRPCTLFWGMGNEAQHLGTYRALADLIHELDPGRPATYAESHFYRGKRAKLTGLPDVWSCNYDIATLDEQHAASGTGAVLVSECCNDQARRGHLEEEIEQAELMIALWKAIDDRPYLAGYALWSFADYPTLYRNRYTRHTGKFDCWRQPKLSAAVFRARHRPELFVKVFGNWGSNGPGRRKIAIATNAERLEIRHGDQAITLDVDGWLLIHELPYRPETLYAEGSRSGESTCDELEPWGPASSLRVEAQQARVSAISRDWVELRIQVLDKQGLRVRDWNGECCLESDGPVRKLTFTPSDCVLVSSGTGRTYLRSTGQEGTVRVRVSASGLDRGEAQIEFDGKSKAEAIREL